MALLSVLLLLVVLPILVLSFWSKKDNSNVNNGIRGVLVHYQSKYSDADNER